MKKRVIITARVSFMTTVEGETMEEIEEKPKTFSKTNRSKTSTGMRANTRLKTTMKKLSNQLLF